MSLDATMPGAAAGRGRVLADWRLLCAVIVVASVALHLAAPLPPDPAWLLTVGERMLAGERLYRDITELNPPMSAWLYLPSVWLAQQLGVRADVVLVLAIPALGAPMIWLSARILSVAGLLEDRAAWWIVLSLALLLAPVTTFAQREHFAVLFVLPMLAAMAVRMAGARPSWPDMVLVGLFGGLTMTVKPHFALAILFPILAAAVRLRSPRPIFAAECWIAGAVVVGFMALAYWLHPDYLTDMLPIASAIYLPHRLPLFDLMARPFSVISVVLIASWVARDGLPKSPLAIVLAGAMAGFFVAYAVQGKGWAYHALPLYSVALIALGLSVARRRTAPPAWRAARPLTTLALTFALSFPAVDFLGRLYIEHGVLKPLVAPHGAGGSVVLLDDDLSLASPLHRMIGATLVNRGPSLWMAGNAINLCRQDASGARRADCEAAIATERRFLREDLERRPPDVILAGSTTLDWLAWAREDPQTAAILDRYREVARHDDSMIRLRVLTRDGAR